MKIAQVYQGFPNHEYHMKESSIKYKQDQSYPNLIKMIGNLLEYSFQLTPIPF